MKKYINIAIYFSIILCGFSCSPQIFLRKKTDRFIEKSYKNADTIYKYSVAFNDFHIIWYHKDDFIYKYKINTFKIKKYDPIIAKNILVSDSSIYQCFDKSIFKSIKCFERMLDGENIELYVKGKTKLESSIDMECLFNEKFKKNTIQYKLQYDFSKIFKLKNFDFEKKYSESK